MRRIARPRTANAAEPKDSKDSEPPQPVADIEPSTVTTRRLTLRWPAASDNVGVIGYRIWLNGFEVATTAETRARLRWFNDDSGQHVVQIRALDAAGNQSRSSPTLVVTRPSPDRPLRRRRSPPTRRRRPTNRPSRPARRAVVGSPSTTPTGRRVRVRAPATLMPTPFDGPGPLVVQSDRTLLLEVDHPDADACRIAIAPFAELERAPEHIHTYRLTPLGLWNARAAGHDAEQVVDTLLTYSRYPVPNSLLVDVAETMDRYGRLRIEKHPTHGLILVSSDRAVLTEVLRSTKVKGLLGSRVDEDTVVVHPSERGHLKQVLLKLGWPAEDLAGYVDGEAHAISLDQRGWTLRPYQGQAADSFWHGGSGVVVLPCGAGQDDRWRCRDGSGQCHHVDLGHEHRRGTAMA